MDLRSRIKSLFAEGVLAEKQSISSILGKKKVLKGLGRKAVKKSKIKGKRKNNYKTQDARRILASKHGKSAALKKVDNKYVMTYDEIAKLMRGFSYSFNKDKGKWLKKKDAAGAAKAAPKNGGATIEPSKPEAKKSSKAKNKVETVDDISDKLKSDKTSSVKPFEMGVNDKENNNYLVKESVKSFQARLIAYLLNTNTEEGGWYDAIQVLTGENGALEFYLPKEKIYEYLETQQTVWIEERKVWIDADGNYPVPDEVHMGRQGITSRAILANEGYINFLDLEETSDEEALDMAKELGYTWVDGVWVKAEAPATENVQRRVFPEPITPTIIGTV